jgi:hypothetical protein
MREKREWNIAYLLFGTDPEEAMGWDPRTSRS